MKKVLLITLLFAVFDLPVTRGQETVQGEWTGISQCYVNGVLVPVRGNCPSASSSSSSSTSNSNMYGGLSQAGYQLGYAFGRWLFGGGSNPQQQLQQQQMMEELARREAEAERRHQEEEARRITAMYNRLYATLKLSGLPDLRLKGVGDSPGLTLKLGDGAGQGGVKRSPGFYVDANGKIQLHGIDGLPGIYADGDGQNAGDSSSKLTLKTGEGSETSSPPPIPPTETGLQLRTGESSTAPPALAITLETSKMTPQQLADVAEMVSKLPPEEQQRLMAMAQHDAGTGLPGSPAPDAASASTQATSHWEAQLAPPASWPGTSQPQPAAGLGQPMTPLNPQATAQLEAQAAASRAAAQAPGLEDASARARGGFDTPLGSAPVQLEGDHTTPALLRPPGMAVNPNNVPPLPPAPPAASPSNWPTLPPTRAAGNRGVGQSVPRTYKPSGNGLIGGTSWVVGYNVQTTDPAVVAEARRMLKKQMELAGLHYDESIDFERYNFVLGIAASANIFRDLASRVVFDEFANGQFSANQQAAYDSLKGRSFDELGCHSNGAMICLAALMNQDITAKHVVLYGPQITPESLYLWNQLVERGQVGSIEMRVNQGDPVPPVSFLSSNPTSTMTAAFVPFLSAPMFNTAVLSKAVTTFAPSIYVKTFACGIAPDLGCHELKVYKGESGN